MNVMSRLKFDCYIHPDMYNLYDSQIKEFSESQKECLTMTLDDYRKDKIILRKLKNKVKESGRFPPVKENLEHED